MVLEDKILSLGEWLPDALLYWLIAVFGSWLLILIVSFLISAAQSGPGAAGEKILLNLKGSVEDVLGFSPRRAWAICMLTVREALRSKVLIVFGIFALLLLVVTWYLDPESNNPAQLYIKFVMESTNFLILILSVVACTFSLPSDIEKKMIFTVVTKPVRPSEIVAGKTAGFIAVGTLLLAAMGGVSYFFVTRSLNHSHSVAEDDLQLFEGSTGSKTRQGRTTNNRGHRHDVVVDEAGKGTTEMAQYHQHEYETVTENGQETIVLGRPINQLNAKVPIYGKLKFVSRDGTQRDRGVNAGYEWTYRTHIEGATLASAEWQFDFSSLRPSDFPEGNLPLEFTIDVFRTYKGEVDRGIVGSIEFINKETGKTSRRRSFVSHEFTVHHLDIPLQLESEEGGTLDLFQELVDSGGKLTVALRCSERSQYFGVAEPDMYILANEASFARNFTKGYLGMWLQMAVLTTFAVMWSTFLTGSVAMLATLATLIGGMFVKFMAEISSSNLLGGGPFESLERLFTQQGTMQELAPTATTGLIRFFDSAMYPFLKGMSVMLPDFRRLNATNFVMSGFDIPNELMLQQILIGIGFILPVMFLGCVWLRIREVAK